MKNLFISIIAICFFVACGGGGYGSNETPGYVPPQALQGIVPEQVDPVQTTGN
jgi:hypothetical protein